MTKPLTREECLDALYPLITAYIKAVEREAGISEEEAKDAVAHCLQCLVFPRDEG